jgi:hypothetical protein
MRFEQATFFYEGRGGRRWDGILAQVGDINLAIDAIPICG